MKIMVAKLEEFENEEAVLEYFNVTEIEEAQPVNHESVAGRCNVYIKGLLNPIQVTLFRNKDGSLRSPKVKGRLESPVDRGTKWTRSDGTQATIHNQFLPNAILDIVEKRANVAIEPCKAEDLPSGGESTTIPPTIPPATDTGKPSTGTKGQKKSKGDQKAGSEVVDPFESKDK